MPGIKDLLEKGMGSLRETLKYKQLLEELNGLTISIIQDLLEKEGYTVKPGGSSQYEYKLKILTKDEDRFKEFIDRDLREKHKPGELERIRNVKLKHIIVDVVFVLQQALIAGDLLRKSGQDDMVIVVNAEYSYEKYGGLIFKSWKHLEGEAKIGGFTFNSAKFIDPENNMVKDEELREFIRGKLVEIGLIKG